MLLSNLKMTAKTSKDVERAENAYLISKLLIVTGDEIVKSPKQLKQQVVTIRDR